METKTYLDINEAAEFLNISVAWLRAQVLNRKIPFYKIGRCVRFSRAELETYVQQRCQEILN
jgi:excisionase family DNA binding protein